MWCVVVKHYEQQFDIRITLADRKKHCFQSIDVLHCSSRAKFLSSMLLAQCIFFAITKTKPEENAQKCLWQRIASCGCTHDTDTVAGLSVPLYHTCYNVFQTMVDSSPADRPTAFTLLQHPLLSSCDHHKTKQQLRKELNEQKFKVEILTRWVQKVSAMKRTAKIVRDIPVAQSPNNTGCP